MSMYLAMPAGKIIEISYACYNHTSYRAVIEMLSAYTELAEEEGYKLGNDVHVLRNGQAQVFNGGV